MPFTNGQRVIYLDTPNAKNPFSFHAASWGENDRVMHLNHKGTDGRILPITGTINRLSFTDPESNRYYSFTPDGWPAENHGFVGFEAHERYFSPLLGDDVFPGTITDRMGKSVIKQRVAVES